jgi:hypothetical protein
VTGEPYRGLHSLPEAPSKYARVVV